MNFELTMEQQQLKDSVTNFARQHLGGKLGTYDFNKYWNACSEFGLFEMPVPNDLEGLDIDPLTMIWFVKRWGMDAKIMDSFCDKQPFVCLYDPNLKIW